MPWNKMQQPSIPWHTVPPLFTEQIIHPINEPIIITPRIIIKTIIIVVDDDDPESGTGSGFLL